MPTPDSEEPIQDDVRRLQHGLRMQGFAVRTDGVMDAQTLRELQILYIPPLILVPGQAPDEKNPRTMAAPDFPVLWKALQDANRSEDKQAQAIALRNVDLAVGRLSEGMETRLVSLALQAARGEPTSQEIERLQHGLVVAGYPQKTFDGVVDAETVNYIDKFLNTETELRGDEISDYWNNDRALKRVQARTSNETDVLSSGMLPRGVQPGQTLTIYYDFDSPLTAREVGLGKSATKYSTNVDRLAPDTQAVMQEAMREKEALYQVRFEPVRPGIPENAIVWAFARGDLDPSSHIWAHADLPKPGSKRQILMFSNDNIQAGRRKLKETALHEMGHALGEAHPHESHHGGKPILSSLYDSRRNTQMSYTHLTDGSPDSPRSLDIAWGQKHLGANTRHHAGNTDYVVTETMPNRTLWDAGGYDRIDAREMKQPVTIDLNAVSPMSPNGISRYKGGMLTAETDLAAGVQIEEAIGTPGPDLLISGQGTHILTGGAGRDTFAFGAKGTHIVTDFVPGEDQLSLNPLRAGTAHVAKTKFGAVLYGTGQDGDAFTLLLRPHAGTSLDSLAATLKQEGAQLTPEADNAMLRQPPDDAPTHDHQLRQAVKTLRHMLHHRPEATEISILAEADPSRITAEKIERHMPPRPRNLKPER